MTILLEVLNSHWGTIVTVILAFIGLMKGQRKIYVSLNSRLSELLAATKKAAFADGKAEGRTEGRHAERAEKILPVVVVPTPNIDNPPN